MKKSTASCFESQTTMNTNTITVKKSEKCLVQTKNFSNRRYLTIMKEGFTFKFLRKCTYRKEPMSCFINASCLFNFFFKNFRTNYFSHIIFRPITTVSFVGAVIARFSYFFNVRILVGTHNTNRMSVFPIFPKIPDRKLGLLAIN